MTNFEMFERDIEPQKGHNMKRLASREKTEIKHKNVM